MRKFLGARLILSMTAVAAIGVWVACGGSDDQDVTDADSGVDTGVDSAKPDTGSGVDAAKDTGIDVYEAGPVYDAGEPNLLDGGPDFEGGIPCVVGGAIEIEPNDTADAATAMIPPVKTICGAVIAADGGPDGGESDWVQFNLGDASTTFYVQYAGNVKVHVETDGMAPVDISAPNATLVMKKGQPYYVEVRSKDGRTQTWRVSLFEK